MSTTCEHAVEADVVVDPAFAGEVDRESVRRAVDAALRHSGEARAVELTVVVTSDARVEVLNREYRGVSASTDVLAFGLDKEAAEFVVSPDAGAYLGDVVISYPRAVEQAREYGHSVQAELSTLVVHGTLHLLGYDHESPLDRELMWQVQADSLRELGVSWRP